MIPECDRRPPVDLGRTATRVALLAAALLAASTTLPAQAKTPGAVPDDLAAKLQNPVASLVSVPIESSWQFSGAARAGDYFGALKPVVPSSLGGRWHLITRTVLPFSYSTLDDGRPSRHVGDSMS